MQSPDELKVPQMDTAASPKVLPPPKPQPTMPQTKDYIHLISESVRLDKKRREDEAYMNGLEGLLKKIELCQAYFRRLESKRRAEAKAKQQS